MSLQEKSESEEDREREERRPCFSSECPPSSEAECESDWDGCDDRVLRGIFAGRREDVWEGMMTVAELFCSSPVRVWERLVGMKMGEKRRDGVEGAVTVQAWKWIEWIVGDAQAA